MIRIIVFRRSVFYFHGLNSVFNGLFLLFLDANNQPIIHRYKSRSLVHKAHMRLDPVGGSWGLFGWHTSITLRLFPRLPSSQEGAVPCDHWGRVWCHGGLPSHRHSRGLLTEWRAIPSSSNSSNVGTIWNDLSLDGLWPNGYTLCFFLNSL